MSILGLKQDSKHNKYLRLPSIIWKSKSQVFAEIEDRVAKKLASWKGKTPFNWWAGDPHQSSCPSSAHIHYELLPTS